MAKSPSVKTEKEDLENHPGPKGWNRYGGWKNGPRLEATGFFRTEKHQGKWWLVDPEGRLFWSQGIQLIRLSMGAALTDREHYFQDLPGRDSPFGRFYGKSDFPWRLEYDYKPNEFFDFHHSNLLRKYGKDYESLYMELVHRRLRSWGQNTIGNWSDRRIKALRKTPYVAYIDYFYYSSRTIGRTIEGSKTYHRKFPDPFSPDFRTRLRERLERERAGLGSWTGGVYVNNKELGGFADDPWCVGIFVDNELEWGSLALASLASPADQPAKIAFVEDLKTKYKEIQNLNDAWGTDHASWNDLLRTTETPDKEKAGPDLRDFYTRLAEEYFRICRAEVKRAAPNHLYLGCRFAPRNELAVRAAAKYCDVISINLYQFDVEDFILPEGIDKPVISSEFNFCVRERGMFYYNNWFPTAENQEDRAAKYKSYVQGALRNPFLVGAHWFCYSDYAATGCGPDGSTWLSGFVDVCDTPYDEIVRAAREVGDILYEYRLKN